MSLVVRIRIFQPAGLLYMESNSIRILVIITDYQTVNDSINILKMHIY